MTFTFSESLTTDLSKVRFWVGDTDENGYYLSDATITALLSSEGSVGSATVAGIQYIIAKLSKPDFRADWLQVSNAEAVRAWERRLIEMRNRFGVAAITVDTVNVYRADSLATEEPDYDDGAVSVEDA
jgi:hypothetical protein